MKKQVLLALAAAAVLAGCSSDEPGGGQQIPTIVDPQFTSRTAEVNESLNKFYFDFFNTAARQYDDIFAGKKDENLSVSPLSASMTLAMLANAGDDECTAQVAKALDIDDLDALNETCNTLLRYLAYRPSGEVFEMVNAVWYDHNSDIKSSFTSTMTDRYYAAVSPLDYTKTSDAVATINAWANEKTHGLIPHVIDNLSADTKVTLANSLYFKGQWESPFDKSLTRKIDFEGTQATRSVDMMHKVYAGSFFQSDKACAVSLPFIRTTNLLVILPAGGISAVELSKQLDLEEWLSMMYNAGVYEITLDLPKFDVYNDVRLEKILAYLGIDTHVASLEKMGLYSDNGFDVAMKQVATTSIDEEGAKAASVTVSGLDTMPYTPVPKDGKVTFTVNQPFLYLIYDSRTKTILMAGRVCNL